MKKYLVALLVVLASVVGLSSDSEALQPLGRIRSYEVTCDTTPRRLSPTTGYVPSSAFKFVNGATQIFIGGSDVNTTTTGTPYAASSRESLDATPREVWCVTSSGSSTVDILAGT